MEATARVIKESSRLMETTRRAYKPDATGEGALVVSHGAERKVRFGRR